MGWRELPESKVFAELLDFKVATPSPKASVQSCEQQTTCSTNIVINPDQLVDVLKVKLISWQWSKAIWYNRTFNKMSKNPLPPVSVPATRGMGQGCGHGGSHQSLYCSMIYKSMKAVVSKMFANIIRVWNEWKYIVSSNPMVQCITIGILNDRKENMFSIKYY